MPHPRRILRLSVLLMAAALLDCGDKADPIAPGATGGRRGGTDPCSDPRLPDVCGSSCSFSSQCSLGTHCDESGSCDAGCSTGTPCPETGDLCSPYGRCVAGGPDPSRGICAATTVQASFVIPTVVILIDQSGSMTGSYPGGTRWTVLRDALTNPTDGVIANLESMVRFGVTFYTSHGSGPTCPILIEVPPKLNNYQTIDDLYSVTDPDSETPTGESIEEVIDALLPYPEPGPKFIVLATDGEPDTCAVPNPQNGQPESIAAAQRARANGISLFILSVGQGAVSQSHLQDMANAGLGLPVGGTTNAPFYEANDQVELARAFDDIVGRVLSCVINVDGTVAPEVASRGTVFLDGDPLVYDDPNGWQYLDPTTIELVGDACAKVGSGGSHFVSIEIGCYDPGA